VLQEILVQRVRNLQPVDERQHRDIFTAIGHIRELVLEVVDVRLEAVTMSYFNSEEVVVVLLGFLGKGVLGKERLGYLLKVVERTW